MKKIFFSKEISKAQKDFFKKAWNLIKESINKKNNRNFPTDVASLIDELNNINIIHESKDIANKLNNFFTIVAEKITKEINLFSVPNITINNFDSKANINSIFLMLISKDEIKNYERKKYSLYIIPMG